MNNFPRKIIPLHRTPLVADPFNFLRQEIDRLFDVSSSLEGLRPQFDTKESDNLADGEKIEKPVYNSINIKINLIVYVHSTLDVLMVFNFKYLKKLEALYKRVID